MSISEEKIYDLVAVYGSPRRHGNTSTLLSHAVQGAKDAGFSVGEFFLRDLNISPCLEVYKCQQDGECAIKDDFQALRDRILGSKGLILASPIFFYTVTAQTKAFMDRFQSLWVRKYRIDQEQGKRPFKRRGAFVSAGATRGPRLFEGAVLSVRYFFDVLDMELRDSLLCRGLDAEKDVLEHPDYLEKAYKLGYILSSSLADE